LPTGTSHKFAGLDCGMSPRFANKQKELRAHLCSWNMQFPTEWYFFAKHCGFICLWKRL
jgi:hypothetical protein